MQFLPLSAVLDSVSPIVRVRLTGELSAITKQLKAGASAIQRVKLSKRISEILRELTGEVADELSDDPNSPNYRYKDTGYIADSRKEQAQSMIFSARKNGQRLRATDIDWVAIEQNPRQAAELITKANLFGKTDWALLESLGMDPAAGFLIDKIYASIGKEPAEAVVDKTRYAAENLEQAQALEDTPLGRKDYAFGLETIRDRLQNRKTVAEVVSVIDEIRDELMGTQLTSSEADAYSAIGDEISSLHEERHRLGHLSDDVYKRANMALVDSSSVERDVENRTKRGWKIDPEKIAIVEKAKRLAEQLWEEFAAIRNDVNPKIQDIEARIRQLVLDQRALVSSARRRNLRQNSATRAWLTFGERFLKLVNYRSFKGSDSFAGHITNAKAGKIKDWGWADKERPTTPKGATNAEIRFQMRVADSYERKGGKTITVNSTAELKEIFGFSEVQSGNWVLKDPNSAKFHVEQTAAAMSDMADILGIDMKLLGYGGRLGMAFGARGTGGKNAARAHYEPVLRVINLTKMGGGGSLGHEWFHSMDNIIHEMVSGQPGAKGAFVSTKPDLLPPGKLRDGIVGVWQSMNTGDVRAPVAHKYTNKDIAAAKRNVDRETKYQLPNLIKSAGSAEKAVLDVNAYLDGYRENKKQRGEWTRIAVAYYHQGETLEGDDASYSVGLRTGASGSSFMAEAVNLDEGVRGKYWSQTEEMAARAFQAYLEDKLADADRRNDYLSAMADNKFYVDPFTEQDFKPFPEGDERKRINAAFDKFFEAIRAEKVFEKAVGNSKLMDSIFGIEAVAEGPA